MSTKALKSQLLAAVAMVLVASVALGSSTFAWFANNNKVTADNMSVSAKSDVSYLLIKAGTADAASVQASKSTTAEGQTSTAALLPAAHETVTKISEIEATKTGVSVNGQVKTNWYYQYAEKPEASAAAESADKLEILNSDFNKYVLVNEFSICTAKGSNKMENLVVSSSTLTTEGDKAVKVLVATDTACVELDNTTTSSSAVLASSVTDNSVVTVKVYIYWDGANENVYTNGIDDLKNTSLSIDFSATPVSSNT